jgi:DNA-binding Xre family transcriptional regulator
MKEHIGNFLQTRLNDLNMNRQDLVYNTGISETNISKHFNGARDISDNDLNKICPPIMILNVYILLQKLKYVKMVHLLKF